MMFLSLPGLLVIVLGLSYFVQSTFGPKAGTLFLRLTFIPMGWLVFSFLRAPVPTSEPGWLYVGYSIGMFYCLLFSGAAALGRFLAKRSESGKQSTGMGLNASVK